MQYFMQLLISGLAIGAIYGLIAMGFAVIYKSTGLVNFAQGEMTMITAYIAWTISTTVSGNVFVVALGAILAAGPPEADFGSILGAVAVGLASINVAGGFLVTQRMLEMFRKKARKVENEAEKK